MKRERGRTATRLAAGAVLAAMGVVLLYVGSLLQVLDLSMAALASFLIVFAVIELGRGLALMIFLVTAILSVVLLPVKTAALIYLLFAGYYPIIKALLERKLPRVAAWAVKCVIFLLGLVGAFFVGTRFFALETAWFFENKWVFLIPLPVFLLYDVALTRVISAYICHWRQRMHFKGF
jgi:hypothetical protein